MAKMIRIGTRESQLAIWQATHVQKLLQQQQYRAELIFIKSEGDIDLETPLYEMGVQGIFTRSLDIALLNDKIDVAVHSMKDVPTQLPEGISQAAVLKRASYKDLLVYKGEWSKLSDQLGVVNGQWLMPFRPGHLGGVNNTNNSSFTIDHSPLTIATSSIRRKAQWLYRYPNHTIENLRGNVNTRLKKLEDSDWNGAIFAAAGLERINLRPANAIELDWMLPAPAQGAIMVMCRNDDSYSLNACQYLNDDETALCTKMERDFLRTLLGGCSTPISALAEIKNNSIIFKGNIVSPDGKTKVNIEKQIAINQAKDFGKKAAEEILSNGGNAIADKIEHAV